MAATGDCLPGSLDGEPGLGNPSQSALLVHVLHTPQYRAMTFKDE